jgi:gamma-glutamylcyclotransferase (GGCT)/AIG2-like uncharacterized protein YtfP
MLLFVYGTLMRGGENHSLLAAQSFMGAARTTLGYTLYSLGSYPGLIALPGDQSGVEGELWRVDHACLARLDDLEGLAEGLYKRSAIALAEPITAEPVETYIYARSIEGHRPIGTRWPA